MKIERSGLSLFVILYKLTKKKKNGLTRSSPRIGKNPTMAYAFLATVLRSFT